MSNRKIWLTLILTLSTSLVWGAWDSPEQWQSATDKESQIGVSTATGKVGKALQIRYRNASDGWVMILKEISEDYSSDRPLVFWVKANSSSNLEIKAIDDDGTNFLKKISLEDRYSDWTRLVIARETLEYGWGGDKNLGKVQEIAFAVSGGGEGTIWLDEIGWGKLGEKASFIPGGPQLDKDRDLSGYGFRQRREKKMIPEEPLVLEWIKDNQDTSSPEKALLSSMEDNIAQTFNNALGAMVFILKGKKARAERILDFYAKAVDPKNSNPTLQNFFFNKEARGFYQNIYMTGEEAYHTLPKGDRWVGDMAWLLLAYKHYDQTYGTQRYQEIENILLNFLASIFREDDHGGYIPSGWTEEDVRFRTVGYGEPNIDAMAAFKLFGEDDIAKDIRTWLDFILIGDRLPLDNYSWRVMAYGKETEPILKIPENDLRFRKTLKVKRNKVMGFFHAAEDINNIWLDSLGHMACAYFTVGNSTRGNFYANQLDKLMIDSHVGGRKTKAFPYTVNKEGGYDWVDPNKPHISVACWYIFAKNRFNPFLLKQF